MVNGLLVAILEALSKHKRRMLDGIELSLPPPLYPPVRKRILRELGKDEFEKELEQIIKKFTDQHGKGR